MTMADTVAVMNKGKIEQMGSPEELYELPRTVFVANFLGQSNLFAGRVAGTTADAISVDVAGQRVVVPASRSRRHSGTVTVGVRPEKLSLHTAPPFDDATRNAVGPGRVIDVSFSGVSTQYLVAIPGMGTVIVFAQNINSGPVARVGEETWVSWDISHGFGLDDDVAEVPRFDSDTDTRSLAAQKRDALIAELEGA